MGLTCRFSASALWGVIVVGYSLTGAAPANAAEKSVKVTAIVDHPALAATRKGVRDELAEAGFRLGGNLAWEFQSAKGDVGAARRIAKKFVAAKPDVIIAITTPSAQAAVAASRGRIPVVFSAVTDPVDTKLVKTWANPGANVTGVSDMLPMRKHLALIAEVMPGVKTIGMPYNPGEANAAVLVRLAQELAPDMGLKIITATVASRGEVVRAVRSLIGKVDAIYVTTDNTVTGALDTVIAVGIEAKLPVFAGDTASVERGAIAAIGFDYYDVGRQTGKIVVKILNGEKASAIAVQSVSRTTMSVNPKSAIKMGIVLSTAVIARANKVIN